MNFPTHYAAVLDRIKQVDPVKYGHSRNYLHGAVTRLSPYLSRGVISTRQVLEHTLEAGYSPKAIEKFIQELAWREYWQLQWLHHPGRIQPELASMQKDAVYHGLPYSVLNHQTGIRAIDDGIQTLYQTGYLHNHVRMYLASLVCNVGRSNWYVPAQWMYYHLLDADWASNAFSWQWVSGIRRTKKYYANQENINQYTHSVQRNTFLDVSYEQLENMQVPQALETIAYPKFQTPLPHTPVPDFQSNLPVLIYNFYNLDPLWRSNMKANRVLLLEPSVFSQYPVCERSIAFGIALAQNNIPGIQVWVAEFSELKSRVQTECYFKEHPFNRYQGIEDAREWMSSVKGDYPSFFSFWKHFSKKWF